MTSRRNKGEHEPESYLPLSNANFHILLALAEGERHGYAIMRDVRAATDGSIRLGPGTLYRCLQGLLDEALIEELGSDAVADYEQRRRYYRLSPFGRRVLIAETQRLAAVVSLAAKRVLQKLPG